MAAYLAQCMQKEIKKIKNDILRKTNIKITNAQAQQIAVGLMKGNTIIIKGGKKLKIKK